MAFLLSERVIQLKLLTKKELKDLGDLVPFFSRMWLELPPPLGYCSNVPKGFLAFITKMKKVDCFCWLVDLCNH